MVDGRVDTVDQVAAAHLHRLAALALGFDQGVDALGLYEVARLGPGFDASLAFQFEVGLAHGGDADFQLVAQPAQGRQPVAGAKGAVFNLLDNQLNDLLVEKRLGAFVDCDHGNLPANC